MAIPHRHTTLGSRTTVAQYALTWEQQQLRELAGRIADEHLAPAARRVESEGNEFPLELLTILRSHGLLGLDVPTEYGGAGLDTLSCAVVLEELARGWFAATSYALQLATNVILAGGSDQQRETYLADIASCRRITAFALTEADSGSDAWAMRTTATPDREFYVLNGRKIFITNAHIADLILVFAKTDRTAQRPGGVSIFIVHRSDPGFRLGQRFRTLAHGSNPIWEILLEDCRVPANRLVGELGEGFAYIHSGFAKSRVLHGIRAVGLAQAGLSYAVRYAHQREQFGRRIETFQGIRFKFADIATQVEAARQLCYVAAAAVDAGQANAPALASMAKMFASDTAMNATTEAVQILGGHGFTTDHPVERYFREAKLMQIGEGTNEIQRLIVSRHVVRQHFEPEVHKQD